MKLPFQALFASLLINFALSQSIFIAFPPVGSDVQPGSNITVVIDRPDSMEFSTEVAVVIAIAACSSSSNTTCPPPQDDLGSILYNGPYNPQFPQDPSQDPDHEPHQNFTVTIPPAIARGTAQLAVFHASLAGLGPSVFTEVENITLNVV